MTGIKEILLSVQERLSESVPGLSYIDKDWGQLSYEQPTIAFPCVLVDIEEISFSQQGKGEQIADTQMTVTIANWRPGAPSLSAPRSDQAYTIIDLLDSVHASLQLFTNGNFAPLVRSSLKKMVADYSKESYQMIYRTTFPVSHDMGEKTTPIHSVMLEVK